MERVRAFIAGDVDPSTRAELTTLVEAGDRAALAERFAGPLEFGTAGLRGLIGAGESRMNRAVVIRATYGLIEHLLRVVPGAAARGVVIGRDARRMSPELQQDAAAVCKAAGVKVHFLSGPTPTPVAAYAVKALGAAAGIVVTASHNPPAYNGYKAYWENGAQIIPPVDRSIAEEIARAPAARDIPLAAAPFDDADAVKERYLAEIAGLVFDPEVRPSDVSIAYSAMHGVGEQTLREVFRRRGFERFHSVPEQAEPDGDFPTVKFPNPEEPGALDRVLKLAQDQRSDVVLVNDPDADRLAVAVRDEDGAYRVLNGNEIGVLLAHYLIAHTEGERLVITTMVSSQLLKKMAAAAGVHYAETATGFKWIANEAIRRAEEARFLFGYEEALGYTVGTSVRDKDGISAALVMAEMAASLAGRGLTLLDQLEAIRHDHGLFASRQKSITLPGAEGRDRIAQAMARLRRAKLPTLGGTEVASRQDLTDHDVLIFDLADGGRVCVRPSGTEPKIKFYLEVVEPADSMSDAEARAQGRLDRAERAILDAAGL